VICKYCQSTDTIKFGTYTDTNDIEIQRYYCKDCLRKFTALDTLPKMKTPMNEISSALNMYYAGMPIDGIQRQVQQEYNHPISEPAIYGWITRFTKEAIAKERNFRPDVGDVWIADETVLHIGGKNVWFWDIIDTKSRYLLATHISIVRNTEDAQILVEKAINKSGKFPKTIITDKLRAYIDGVELGSKGKVQHIRSKPFTDVNSTNMIERFHGILKQRTNVIHHFKDVNTARLLTEGWLIHYNFFKDHESLNNESPAKHMKLDMPFNDWDDIVRNTNVFEPAVVTFGKDKPFHRPSTPQQKHDAYMRKAVRKSVAKKRKAEPKPSASIQTGRLK
jgi:transposase-like protein